MLYTQLFYTEHHSCLIVVGCLVMVVASKGYSNIDCGGGGGSQVVNIEALNRWYGATKEIDWVERQEPKGTQVGYNLLIRLVYALRTTVPLLHILVVGTICHVRLV